MKFALFIWILSFQAFGTNIPRVFLEKNKNQEWFVSFEMTQETKQLGFMRNPDGSRVKRWTSLDPNIELIYRDGKEYILSKDRKPFTSVKFRLTPTYIALPKEYAPFSRYSDGGILFHDARFQVCPLECKVDHKYLWNFRLQIPPNDLAVVHGKLRKKAIAWQVKDDGSLIYVGKRSPRRSNAMLSIIDPELPKPLLDALNNELPKYMAYFAETMGVLDTPPSLFASFEKIKSNSRNQQGGVLPGQIFMHWTGPNLDKVVADENAILGLKWFFAHEAAHVYQSPSVSLYDNQHAWIHEGGAELLAYLALQEVTPSAKNYAKKRYSVFVSKCRAKAELVDLKDATKKGQFKAHYDCGFLIHYALKASLDRRGGSYYDLWAKYRKAVERGKEPGRETFLEIVARETSKGFRKKIDDMINNTAEALPRLLQ
ncbi:MAG: hypothetical protein HRU19_30770 [Pseudobacteriovorax sp.]|nr:hypothetical protein [Pseudobacteriovorax sp.]